VSRVTYRGPRPELVPSLPLPVGDFYVGATTDEIRVISWATGRPTAATVWNHYPPVLRPGVPAQMPALFAVGLAMIRRRPSPWFEVRLSRGEWRECCARVPGLWRYNRRILLTPRRRRLFRAHVQRQASRRGDDPWSARPLILSRLRWSSKQIAEVYLGERKPMYANGELVYAPPGWKEIERPDPSPLTKADLNDAKGILP